MSASWQARCVYVSLLAVVLPPAESESLSSEGPSPGTGLLSEGLSSPPEEAVSSRAH